MGSSITRGGASSPSTTSWRTGPPRRVLGLVHRLRHAHHLRPDPAPGLRGLVASARAAETEHRQPRGAGVPDGGSRTLDPAGGRRLAPGCARGDHHPRVLGGVPLARRAANPEAYLVGEIWHVAPEWTAHGDRFDGVMNYVLTEAVLRFAAGAHRPASRSPGEPHAATGFGRSRLPVGDRPLAGHLSPGGPPRQPEPAGIARHPAGAEHGGGGSGVGDAGGGTDFHLRWGAVHLLRGRGGHDGPSGPGSAGLLSVGAPRRMGPALARGVPQPGRAAADTPSCGAAPTGTWRRRGCCMPSAARAKGSAWWWRSTPGSRPRPTAVRPPPTGSAGRPSAGAGEKRSGATRRGTSRCPGGRPECGPCVEPRGEVEVPSGAGSTANAG